MPVKITHRHSSGSVYRTQVNGGTRTLISSNNYGHSWDDTFIGVSLPNYKSIIRHRGNATTGAQGHRETNSGINGSVSLYYDTIISDTVRRRDGSEVEGQLYGLYPWVGAPSYSTSSADAAARSQFISKYRQERTKFQSGVFFGELAETVRMLRSPVQALRQSLDTYHSVVKKRLKGQFIRYREFKNRHLADRTVAETWLEYSYGIRPLLSDIVDIASIPSADPTTYRKVISGSCTVDADFGVLRVQDSFGPMTYWSDLVYKGKVSVRYKGAVSGTVTPPPSFSEQLGLSWSNVLPTAWELIPYSFVLDYFTNIGKIIEGLSSGIIALDWGVRSERITVTREVSRSAVTHSIHPSQNPSALINVPSQKSEFVNFTRSGVSHLAVGLTDFHFKMPGVTSTKWLNLAALGRLRFL